MELTGSLIEIGTAMQSKKCTVTFIINERNELLGGYTSLKDKEKLAIEIKPYRKKRSLNANAYCWQLCCKIADVLRSDKESVYLNALKSYGQSEIVSVRSDIDVSGYFKYFDEVGTGNINQKEFTHYKVYKGSSEYDTKEMSILIDGIVQEAQAIGIQTKTPDELARIKASWGEG